MNIDTNNIHNKILQEYYNYIFTLIQSNEQNIILLTREHKKTINSLLQQVIQLPQIIQSRHNIINNEYFLSLISDEYQSLFRNILKYRKKISKEEIVNNITQLLIRSHQNIENPNTICILWITNSSYDKSVPNYNLFFCNQYSKFYKNTYLLNITPSVYYKEDSEQDELILLPDILQLLKSQRQHNYIYIDDVSYSGNQLISDIQYWIRYIIDNFKDTLSKRGIKYCLKIHLYAITTNAYLNYYQYIKYIENDINVQNYFNKNIFIELYYSELLYSSIPYIFEKYIEYTYQLPHNPMRNCFIGKDSKFRETYFQQRLLSNIKFTEDMIQYDKNLDRDKIYQINYYIDETLSILSQYHQSVIIKFGNFYFSDEMIEFCKFGTKRHLSLYYLDYKIPDDRSINNKLFYGLVPESFLQQHLSQLHKIGSIENENVYQLQLYDDYYQSNISNYKFVYPSFTHSINTLYKHQSKLFPKPYIPWYKLYTS